MLSTDKPTLLAFPHLDPSVQYWKFIVNENWVWGLKICFKEQYVNKLEAFPVQL